MGDMGWMRSVVMDGSDVVFAEKLWKVVPRAWTA